MCLVRGGTITGVTPGTGLTGGGTTGTVTLNVTRPVPAGGSNSQILGLSGGNPAWIAQPATNLGISRQAASIGISSSTGRNITVPAASQRKPELCLPRTRSSLTVQEQYRQ